MIFPFRNWCQKYEYSYTAFVLLSVRWLTAITKFQSFENWVLVASSGLYESDYVICFAFFHLCVERPSPSLRRFAFCAVTAATRYDKYFMLGHKKHIHCYARVYLLNSQPSFYTERLEQTRNCDGYFRVVEKLNDSQWLVESCKWCNSF